MSIRTPAKTKLIALLAACITAVVISGWLAFVATEQLSDHNKRQTTATEYALTLTRLANQLTETGSAEFSGRRLQGDAIARLIAMGDVQTNELSVTPGSGLLKRPEISALHTGGESITEQWQAIRKALSALTTPVTDDPVEAFPGKEVLQDTVRVFDSVFTAITNETLSVPLLRAVSEIKAELANLLFIAGLPATSGLQQASFDATGRLLQRVTDLQKLSAGEQAVSILGYESNLLLQTFVAQVAKLKSETPRVTGESSLSPGNADPALQNRIAVALDQNAAYRRVLDSAIQQYRRAILGALACVCAALLLSAILTWRLWQKKWSSDASAAVDLGLVVEDINALADGNLATEVRSLPGESLTAEYSRQISRAVNYTGKMLNGLVEVSLGVADRTSKLASHQHQVAEDLVETELARQHAISKLVEGITSRTESMIEQCDTESAAYKNLRSESTSGQQITERDPAEWAQLTAQLELGTSRLVRSVDAVNELSSLVNKMQLMAEKSGLHALNTSIQMTAYSDGGDTDVSPEFADQVQRTARKLEASATDANRLLGVMKADLQSCELAMASCATAINNNVDNVQKRSGSSAGVKDSFEEMGDINARLIAGLRKEAENLSSVADSLCQLHESGDTGIQLTTLIESSQDLHTLAVNFDESLSRYALREHQPVDR